MNLSIITPDEALFEGQASAVSVPGIDGSLGILDNHAPLITALKAGKIKVTSDGTEKYFDVNGGVTEVMNNKVIILAE